MKIIGYASIHGGGDEYALVNSEEAEVELAASLLWEIIKVDEETTDYFVRELLYAQDQVDMCKGQTTQLTEEGESAVKLLPNDVQGSVRRFLERNTRVREQAERNLERRKEKVSTHTTCKEMDKGSFVEWAKRTENRAGVLKSFYDHDGLYAWSSGIEEIRAN